MTERVDTAVIGGGQAGLAVGHELHRHGRSFVILEAGLRLGESWRTRWDSLRLFTPACFTHLPGMPFPARGDYLPTKDEMADYLEAYAARFALPVQLGVGVDELVRVEDHYLITAGTRRLEADHVVVATGANAIPRVPAFADQLDPAIHQLHSVAYRHPDQLREGAALVVGAGNSGAEIALDLASSHQTWLAGRDVGHIPITVGCVAYPLLRRLRVDSWPGRWVAEKRSSGGDIVVRVRPRDLVRAGVRRVERVAGVRGGQPVLANGHVLKAENVIWCTGFARDYRWIKLPVFGADGAPAQSGGVVPSEPGLYFVGSRFQSSVVSDLVGGVGADARHVVQQIATRRRRSI